MATNCVGCRNLEMDLFRGIYKCKKANEWCHYDTSVIKSKLTAPINLDVGECPGFEQGNTISSMGVKNE